MGSTRLEIKLGPCYFESRNRCTAGMPPGGRGRRRRRGGARPGARGGRARAPPGGADVRKGRTRKKPEGVQQYIYTRVIPQACFRIGPPLSSLFACAFRSELRSHAKEGGWEAPRKRVRSSFRNLTAARSSLGLAAELLGSPLGSSAARKPAEYKTGCWPVSFG